MGGINTNKLNVNDIIDDGDACDNDDDDENGNGNGNGHCNDNGDGEDAGGVLVLGDMLPDASRALDTVCRYYTASILPDI